MTTFGIEFEFEGLSPRSAAEALNAGGIACDVVREDIHETYPEWKAVYDGSLNNGAEIVSPILNDRRLNEAHKVTSILSKAGARTSRTAGYHVHLGFRAFESDDALAQFVLNYWGIHHAFAALVSPSRTTGNRFCRVKGRDEAEADAQWLRDGNSGTRTGDRYCSLNLESMQRHETIEVRLHQSTLNGVKAIAWAKLMEALVKTANAGTDLTALDSLNAWQPIERYRVAARSVADCITLLDVLTANGTLPGSTADWLKTRAKVLN